MSSRQDRQGARTPADLERKYNFGENFHEIKESIEKQNIQMDKQNQLFGNYVTENDKAVSKLEQGLSAAERNMSDVLQQVSGMQKAFEEFMTSTNNSLSKYWQTVYPVGSIYMSLSSADPGTLFGGTWERIRDRFILAAGNTYGAGATGGEATHTLSGEEIPSHGHGEYADFGTAAKIPLISDMASGSAVSGAFFNPTAAYSISHSSKQIETSYFGGSQPHNNMPPYIVVYVWKRTA